MVNMSEKGHRFSRRDLFKFGLQVGAIAAGTILVDEVISHTEKDEIPRINTTMTDEDFTKKFTLLQNAETVKGKVIAVSTSSPACGLLLNVGENGATALLGEFYELSDARRVLYPVRILGIPREQIMDENEKMLKPGEYFMRPEFIVDLNGSQSPTTLDLNSPDFTSSTWIVGRFGNDSSGNPCLLADSSFAPFQSGRLDAKTGKINKLNDVDLTAQKTDPFQNPQSLS